MSPGPRAPRRRRFALLAVVAALGLAAVIGAAALLRAGPFSEPTAAAGPLPRFVDETSSSGLAHTYGGGFAFATGGGVAAFDCDEDGRQDLYLAGGEGPAALFRNVSEIGGALDFERIVDSATDLTAVSGAYPIDVDSDGLVDLMTLRLGGNVALRGLGGCRFEPANEAWGIDGGTSNTKAFSATWERGAEWPTLAFGNYLQPGDNDVDTRCRPSTMLRAAPLPDGDGTLRYQEHPFLLAPSYCALSMLFSDWSGSGRADLRVSNDRAFYRAAVGQEQLWRIEPGRAPTPYTEADGWQRVQVEGMGIGSYDLTGDGRPEIYLTSQAASKLQTLADPAGDRPTYRDIGLAAGVNVAHPFTGDDMDLPSTAWHSEFADVNDDGLIDLFVSKGNTTEVLDYAMQDPSNLLLGRPDGTFTEVADVAGILTFDRGRGAALVDFNLDGRLDLVESFYGAPARVWRNLPPETQADAARRHWVAIRADQIGQENVDAIGGWLDVRVGDTVVRRELTIGGGHAGGQLGWIHVGLGPETRVEVRVRWPDGEIGPWMPVAADSFGIVRRGRTAIEPFVPRS